MQATDKDLHALASILENPIQASELAHAIYDLLENEDLTSLEIENLEFGISLED